MMEQITFNRQKEGIDIKQGNTEAFYRILSHLILITTQWASNYFSHFEIDGWSKDGNFHKAVTPIGGEYEIQILIS